MTSNTDTSNGRTVPDHLDGNPARVLDDPMTDREETIMRATNRLHGDDCPECGRTVEACDLTRDNELYIVHEGDPEPSTQTRGHDAGRCRIDPDTVDLD